MKTRKQLIQLCMVAAAMVAGSLIALVVVVMTPPKPATEHELLGSRYLIRPLVLPRGSPLGGMAGNGSESYAAAWDEKRRSNLRIMRQMEGFDLADRQFVRMRNGLLCGSAAAVVAIGIVRRIRSSPLP